ncbi:MAG TPA: ABC transporter ATP-binding protein [Chthoniobacterales bacterium]|jgi:ABC-type sugar transport system ATPase subunit|nr:ABC transporter ATP-binding protein [Chthoniobacterales bacterium]
MVEVQLQNISKSYARKRVLQKVDLKFEKGKFSVVFGSPVSGKSVLMRLIMGLESPDSGSIFLRGREVTGLPAGVRNFGYVPQSFALYPHYRVFDNIAYPLTLARKSREAIRGRVEPLAKKLKIDALLDKYPNQLSGGEKQRVALARGIVKDSEVFILDDPLVGLDFKLREQLFVDLRLMLSEIDGTFIYTTSDPLETLALADDVFVLDQGEIVDQGSVDHVYEEPSNLRAFQLLGFPGANTIPGSLVGGICRSAFGEFGVELADSAGQEVRREVTIGFRPEAVLLDEEAKTAGALRFDARELLREDLGAETIFYFEAAGFRYVGYWSNGSAPPQLQEVFQAGLSIRDLVIFESATGRRLGRGKDSHVGSAVGKNS